MALLPKGLYTIVFFFSIIPGKEKDEVKMKIFYAASPPLFCDLLLTN